MDSSGVQTMMDMYNRQSKVDQIMTYVKNFHKELDDLSEKVNTEIINFDAQAKRLKKMSSL